MKKTRPALFENYVVENGQRRRATRADLAEAHRLWWKHSDIRTGRVLPAGKVQDSDLALRENAKGAS